MWTRANNTALKSTAETGFSFLRKPPSTIPLKSNSSQIAGITHKNKTDNKNNPKFCVKISLGMFGFAKDEKM